MEHTMLSNTRVCSKNRDLYHLTRIHCSGSITSKGIGLIFLLLLFCLYMPDSGLMMNDLFHHLNNNGDETDGAMVEGRCLLPFL